jgi:hypothetical protein
LIVKKLLEKSRKFDGNPSAVKNFLPCLSAGNLFRIPCTFANNQANRPDGDHMYHDGRFDWHEKIGGQSRSISGIYNRLGIDYSGLSWGSIGQAAEKKYTGHSLT